MSKVLIIPDIHLKHKMLDLASFIMKNYEIDYAVVLGDTIDDFYAFEDDYKKTNAKLLEFYYMHKNTIFLWGNHEVHALLDRPVTGNISCSKTYARLYQENFNPKVVHIDNKVIFSHAGIFNNFSLLNEDNLNNLDLKELMTADSPIWARHNYSTNLYVNNKYKNYIQVVGHTPEREIREDIVDGCKIISTDVFSTNWGKKIGEEKFIVIDTTNGKYFKVDIDYRNFK